MRSFNFRALAGVFALKPALRPFSYTGGMSRLEEWCSNLFRVLAHSAGGKEPARIDKKEEEARKSGDSGRSGGSGGMKIIASKTAPSPFSNTGGGGM
jgi:hypothetical protein